MRTLNILNDARLQRFDGKRMDCVVQVGNVKVVEQRLVNNHNAKEDREEHFTFNGSIQYTTQFRSQQRSLEHLSVIFQRKCKLNLTNKT